MKGIYLGLVFGNSLLSIDRFYVQICVPQHAILWLCSCILRSQIYWTSFCRETLWFLQQYGCLSQKAEWKVLCLRVNICKAHSSQLVLSTLSSTTPILTILSTSPYYLFSPALVTYLQCMSRPLSVPPLDPKPAPTLTNRNKDPNKMPVPFALLYSPYNPVSTASEALPVVTQIHNIQAVMSQPSSTQAAPTLAACTGLASSNEPPVQPGFGMLYWLSGGIFGWPDRTHMGRYITRHQCFVASDLSTS